MLAKYMKALTRTIWCAQADDEPYIYSHDAFISKDLKQTIGMYIIKLACFVSANLWTVNGNLTKFTIAMMLRNFYKTLPN